jgi:hypothetical protein
MAAVFVARQGAAAPIPGLYATFGSNSESKLARIDPDTGKVTVIGQINGADVGMVGDLAYDSRHDTLYGVAWSKQYMTRGYDGTLFRIDPGTARAERVGPTGHQAVDALAYDPKRDILYGNAGYYLERYLITIDRDTGAGTRFGRSGLGASESALAYLPGADRLLSIHVPFDPPNTSLWEVDQRTGLQRPIGRTGAGGIYGMAYDPITDRLYALPGSSSGADPGGYLLTINPKTGVATRHQTLSLTALYNSMTFVVPEPTTAAATMAMAAVAMGCSRRARGRQNEFCGVG